MGMQLGQKAAKVCGLSQQRYVYVYVYVYI